MKSNEIKSNSIISNYSIPWMASWGRGHITATAWRASSLCWTPALKFKSDKQFETKKNKERKEGRDESLYYGIGWPQKKFHFYFGKKKWKNVFILLWNRNNCINMNKQISQYSTYIKWLRRKEKKLNCICI